VVDRVVLHRRTAHVASPLRIVQLTERKRFSGKMVDAAGIEPATPAMSTVFRHWDKRVQKAVIPLFSNVF
jgi:hypothetical protein